MTFTISEGSSRTAKLWKPVQYNWSGFCKRLEEPVRTNETAAQYAAASRDIQANLKDVGGFVGGPLRDNKRSAQTVENRQLVTLDADYADADFLENLPWSVPWRLAAYSTHSHTEERPRLRLIIPINRPVTPDEYEPIARKAAENIGLQYFDPTTFQASRLMYWPSASSDAPYVFREFEGDILDADTLLADYDDWRNVSSWPACPSEGTLTQRADKTENPLEKGGLIGAFCNAYTIPEAIEAFIPDVYVATDGFSDRYTYTGGSTSGGLVLFDEGTLALSYHATDPANNGHEVNAFDLVRIHKFAEKDARCRETTPTENRPSYKAMIEFATADPKTAGALMRQRTAAAEEAFSSLSDPPETDDSWMDRLDVEKNGQAANTLENLHIIMQHDPKLKNAIAFNAFRNQICIVKPLPWHPTVHKVDGDPWANVDDVKLQRYLERYRTGFSRQSVLDQVADVAETHSYHPVRDYLKTLTWDGKPRVDTLLIDRLGAETTPETEDYIRAVTRKMLVGAVARVFEPGCMMQYMLVLTGPQNLGKSTIIADLARGWFSDSISGMIGTKEAQDSIQGYWIIEMSELAAMRKVEVEPMKAFITQRVDVYRGAYDRRKEEHPRQCIFIGTTNSDAFLRDETGDRRYWPVPVSEPYDRLTPDEIDQVWAEARTLYEAGEPLFLPPELEAVARMMQGQYRMEDPWTAEIAAYLERPIPADWYSRSDSEKALWLAGTFPNPDIQTMQRDTVTMAEVWEECLGGNARDLKKNVRALHQAMAGVRGWYKEPKKIKFQGQSVRAYRRDTTLTAPDGKIIKMSDVKGRH